MGIYGAFGVTSVPYLLPAARSCYGRPMRTLRLPLLLVALASAAACISPPPLDPALEVRAKAAIAEQKPVRGAPEFRAAWLADLGEASNFVCGRIAAPPELREDTLRFVYVDRDNFAHVERHELWVGDTAGMMLLEQNRQIFDRLWNQSCAPTEPSAFASFFS